MGLLVGWSSGGRRTRLGVDLGGRERLCSSSRGRSSSRLLAFDHHLDFSPPPFSQLADLTIFPACLTFTKPASATLAPSESPPAPPTTFPRCRFQPRLR